MSEISGMNAKSAATREGATGFILTVLLTGSMLRCNQRERILFLPPFHHAKRTPFSAVRSKRNPLCCAAVRAVPILPVASDSGSIEREERKLHASASVRVSGIRSQWPCERSDGSSIVCFCSNPVCTALDGGISAASRPSILSRTRCRCRWLTFEMRMCPHDGLLHLLPTVFFCQHPALLWYSFILS